jgi:hypothetical protein
MRFKRGSSRVERGKFHEVESPEKIRKGFVIAYQNIIRARKRIQNPFVVVMPTCYHRSCSLGKY